MIFEKNDTLLFIGDSISDYDRKRPIGEGLFNGWGTSYVANVGALLGCMLFGMCTGLKVILGTSSPISAQLISMIPYVVTIIVLVLFVGKSHVPAANGKPYVKSK